MVTTRFFTPFVEERGGNLLRHILILPQELWQNSCSAREKRGKVLFSAFWSPLFCAVRPSRCFYGSQVEKGQVMFANIVELSQNSFKVASER